jgi:hypothetical protein
MTDKNGIKLKVGMYARGYDPRYGHYGHNVCGPITEILQNFAEIEKLLFFTDELMAITKDEYLIYLLEA